MGIEERIDWAQPESKLFEARQRLMGNFSIYSYDELLFAAAKYDLKPFRDYFHLYHCTHVFNKSYNEFRTMTEMLVKHGVPEEYRISYRRTQMRGLGELPVQDLRKWPKEAISSFVDEAIAENELLPT